MHAALGYYRAMTPFLPEPVRRPITVDMITMVGDADGFITQSETEGARKFTTAGYQVVNLHGGHFVHRQDPRFPDALADAARSTAARVIPAASSRSRSRRNAG